MLRCAQPSGAVTGEKANRSIKETDLGVFFFRFEFVKVRKNLTDIMHDSGLLTGFVEQVHQFGVAGAVDLVPVSEFPDIALFHAWKVHIQFGVEVFPASFPKGQSHVKAKDSLYTCIDAAV